MDTDPSDWYVPCLPDAEDLKPSPEELEMFYQRLEAGETIELSWNCPGRRLPSPATKDEGEIPESSNMETYVFCFFE